jgi:exosortase/archaeosortase family protein
MRVLIGLCALGVAITYLADRPNWQRVAMVLLCLPIAVFTNLVRVTTTGLFHLYGMDDIASGAGHTGWGIVMYSLALALFYGVSWVLSRLIIEDESPAVPAT